MNDHTCITHTRAYAHTHTHIHTYTQICEEVYGGRLRRFVDIRSVYDFDVFVKEYRPKKADDKIKRTYRFVIEVREDFKVFVRGKQAVGAKTPWLPWVQMYPSLHDLRPHTPHSPSVVPTTAANKEWEDFEKHVVPTLVG